MAEIELDVPYVEKDFAKSLGARWNPVKKIWYIPSGMSLKPFVRWLGAEFEDLEQVVEADADKSFISLSDYLLKIAIAVSSVGSQPAWIKAEISHISAPKKGNVYLELVEHGDHGNTVAKARAAIWRSQVSAIFDKFEKVTQSSLVADIKIMVLVTTKYDPLYGTTITIEDIDPAYTLGDMAEKLAKIRKQLQDEQLYDKNKALVLPNNYQHVAVISPVDAAGLGDFKREAMILEKYQLCKFKYFPCVFQGLDAPIALTRMLDIVLQEHSVEPFDAVIIIRGGGATTDLAWLNDYQLAKTVCSLPIPVFTGIGHQKDNTILDEIARLRFDTPSKVSGYLFSFICRYIQQTELDYQVIVKAAVDCIYIVAQVFNALQGEVLQSMHRWVETASVCSDDVLKMIAERSRSIQHEMQWQVQQTMRVCMNEDIRPLCQLTEHHGLHLMRQITTAWHHECLEQTHRIKQLIEEIIGFGPQKTLKRGFALVQNSTDKTIISHQYVAAQCKQFVLQFYDGSLMVKPMLDDEIKEVIHEK